GLAGVECFPTASWTRWFGARGALSRATWTARAVAALAIKGVPTRLNQDTRDAVGAALTARAVSLGEVDWFGPIAVPKRPVSQGLSLGQAGWGEAPRVRIVRQSTSPFAVRTASESSGSAGNPPRSSHTASAIVAPNDAVMSAQVSPTRSLNCAAAARKSA